MKALTAKDCTEIYYALDSKLADVVHGEYSESPRDPACRKWAEHLKAIMQKIGPDGRRLCRAQKGQSK